ncbi:glycosyltransferase [Streptomyces sp. NBC_00019]|uniref:glycosyltransferase n=1 Tax=Streptomyces sp. NBC_00019 TaxID=2975623 RepID=UPI0032523851
MNETNAGGVRRRSVQIVVPVHNEAHVLAESVGCLHTYLEESFPFPFRITVADNASTDATWQEATELTLRLPHVHAVRLEEEGRGRALKHVWSRSTADVVAYMDVDLSTGLEGFLPLVAPLLSGHSDLAIGSRLHRQAAVTRGAKREFVSRTALDDLKGMARVLRTGRTRISVPRRTSTPQVPAARPTTPAVHLDHLEYAS